MASKRSPQDEKLINDLYEKLNWFTFQASGEEFDADQVKAILHLLDTLDPMPETETGNTSEEENMCARPSDPDAAFERFKQKYHITEEELAEKEAGNPAAAGSDEKIRSFPAEFAEELVPDENSAGAAEDRKAAAKKDKPSGHEPEAMEAEAGKECGGKASLSDARDRHRRGMHIEKSSRHRRFFSGVFGRVAAGLLIVVGATAFLSIGTSAVQQKSFFEIVRDGVNSMKITVTGNDMGMESQSEPTLSLESEEKVYFESWDEVKEENPDILVPGYIPEGLELKELYKQELGDHTHYFSIYCENNRVESLTMGVRTFKDDYSERSFNISSDWDFIEQESGVLFYKSENHFQAIFENHKELYYIIYDNIEEIKDIINGMI